jgi:hypothetical protein
MVHVICYVAGIVVQDLTCNTSRTSFSLSETLDGSVLLVVLAEETGKEEKRDLGCE